MALQSVDILSESIANCKASGPIRVLKVVDCLCVGQSKQKADEVSHTNTSKHVMSPSLFGDPRQFKPRSSSERFKGYQREITAAVNGMSSQYAFAPYQEPPEDIPAHEREQAAFHSASHYSSEGTAAQSQGEAFIGGGGGDDRINQYETSLPLRYVVET
jgi:hypothetical protein